MLPQDIFEQALNIDDPWYIKDIDFDPESKRLDVYIDFHKGAVFHYESPSKDVKGDFKAPTIHSKKSGVISVSLSTSAICTQGYHELR